MIIRGLVKLILSCVVLFFLNGISLNAQTSNPILTLPNAIPPSPNAASLGKFGDIPVGKYTGLPQINIPLYTAKIGSFTLPISLDYHSGGLKVEEISSCIGLGWALNAGGVITRSIRGVADESFKGYWNIYGYTNDYIANSILNTISFFDNYTDGGPDNFFYNFAGQSGKFILDTMSQHNARFIPFNNLRLSHGSLLQDFQITDASGIIYNFNDVENTTNDDGTTIQIFPSAWYLTSIITPAGTVNFTYRNETSHQIARSETDEQPMGPNICSDPRGTFSPSRVVSQSDITIVTKTLVQITTPFETISFQSVSARKDMPTQSRINGMTVVDKKGVLIKKFSFDQSYFGEIESTDQNRVRLKLDGVSELSVVDGTKKSYTLQYNSPDLVPSILSHAKDFWGYYNGHNENNSELPFVDPGIYGPYPANRSSVYGIRTPSPENSKVGVLKSIEYPTGGTSEFIYEGNDYSHTSDMSGPIVRIIPHVISAGARIVDNLSNPFFSVPFTVSTAQNATLVLDGSYSGPPPVGDGPDIFLYRTNADGSITTLIHGGPINTSDTRFPYLDPGNYTLQVSVDGTGQSISAELTYYEQDTAAIDLPNIAPTGGVRIRQIVNTDPISGSQNVKVFSYRDPKDNTLSSGTLVSNLQALEIKESNAFGCQYLLRASTPCNYLGSTQGSHIGYGVVTESDSGSVNIGKKVSYYSNPFSITNAGADQYWISTLGSYRNASRSSRYVTDFDPYRGYMQKELDYNGVGSLVRSEVTHYNFEDSLSQLPPNNYVARVVSGYTYYMCAYSCGQCTPVPEGPDLTPCSDYAIKNYTLVNFQVLAPWVFKTSSVTTLFDPNGQYPITDSIQFFYDNPAHGLVTRTLKRNSKGELLKTVNIYPGDKAMITGLDPTASTVLDNMVNRNMVAPLVQQEQYKNDVLVSRSRTDYGLWSRLPGNVAPISVWYQTLSNPLEKRLQFFSYDSNNNVLEMEKDNDMHISYIWDYNSSYPVAEVKNGSNQSVAYTSFEADGMGGIFLENNGQGILSTDAITGKKCYAIDNVLGGLNLDPSKTYIVSLWAKNGTPRNSGFNGNTQTVADNSTWTKGKTVNGWTYLEKRFSGVTRINVGGGGGLVDEVRFYPAEAQMTTFTYSPLIGMTSKCDVNNRITYYEYDGLGRLKLIRDQDNNIVKTYDYHYQGQ